MQSGQFTRFDRWSVSVTAIYRQLRRIVSHLAASHNFLFADEPSRTVFACWEIRSALGRHGLNYRQNEHCVTQIIAFLSRHGYCAVEANFLIRAARYAQR